MSESTALEGFRSEVRDWLADNFPASLAGAAMGQEGETEENQKADFELWRQRLADKGWGAPTWSREYGGAGLSHPEAKVISQEMGKMGAYPLLIGP